MSHRLSRRLNNAMGQCPVVRPSHVDNGGTPARGISTSRCPVVPSLFRPTGVRSVSHELNMFNSCDRASNCSTDYTIWSQSHWPAMWHLECWRDFEVKKLLKKTTLFCGKQTTKNTEGRQRWTPDASMYRLHICCTMRVNGSFAAIRGNGNAEFFTCGMRKSDKG